MAISKIKKNSLTTGIIDEELLTADVITEQTELAEIANDADFILVYDTSAGSLKKVLKSNFTLQVPTITSISPSTVASDGSTLHNITITGSGFSTSPTVTFVDTNGATYTSGTVTRNSATELVAATTATMAATNDPHDVKVTNSNGLAATLEDSLDMGSTPTFVTAAGSLATVFDGARGSAVTATITDPDSSGTIEVSVSAGSLPAGASLSQSQSPGLTIVSISGFNAVGSETTSTFTLSATDGINTNTRQYTITVNPPAYQTFTSSGTFTVPTGLTSVTVLVVGGGGSGGAYRGGGGGAGGLIYRPGFTIAPGTPISVTVGDGGATAPRPSGNTNPGQDSVFSTLTAKGGGGGVHASGPGSQGSGGSSGGSPSLPGSMQQQTIAATQPSQPGESGNYGFGNPGGAGAGGAPKYGAGGGGGAGAAGAGGTTSVGGNGGVGKAYTISDGTTSVFYAGGGSGGAIFCAPASSGGQGGGGSSPTSPRDGTAGTANRGGGGGGANNANDGTTESAGAGGKGIVIVQY
jgi:hypothetical protein